MLVPAGSGAEARVRGALVDLADRGVAQPDGRPGPSAAWLVAGGFARARADLRDHEGLWGNQQGGFQVRCPGCGGGLARALGARPEAHHRAVCPGCGVDRALAELDYRPLVAFGRAALVVSDAGDAALTADAQAWANRVLGPWTLVWRRVG